MTPRSPRQQKASQQPLDRAAKRMMAAVAVLIAVMLLLGSQSLVQVRSFSWQGKSVSSDDVAFLLTFTRPVAPESVEENLSIEPNLRGKFSWAGRRMAYTLEVPAAYGETYTLSLPAAASLLGKVGFDPFEATFKTRDRVLAYIGTADEEKGRIVLFNLTEKKKTLLTPEDQLVMDFKVYPNRDRILYSAVSKRDQDEGLLTATQIYTITTGLEVRAAPPAWQFWRSAQPTAGEIETILTNANYQNLKFDLSPNGEVIVVQRLSKENPADSGPWVVRQGEPPRKLETEPSGDFTIAPDSASLLLQQGQGTAVIALDQTSSADDANADNTNANENDAGSEGTEDAEEQSDELLDFLPDYGLTLDIANDGSAAALVNFNQDNPDERFTQSLFLVSNRGKEKQLLQTSGSIVSAQFNEDNNILYCLINKLVEIEEEEFLAIPYLTAINTETGIEQKLLEMPPQSDITVALSPDGLAILFDEALATEAQAIDESFSGPTHRLWLLPLFSTLEERLAGAPIPLPPTELDTSGRNPKWLP
ncbi:MAG: hypothetical protein AAF703_15085 [Cyanobacteria bacterium P01_D01_bin.105]